MKARRKSNYGPENLPLRQTTTNNIFGHIFVRFLSGRYLKKSKEIGKKWGSDIFIVMNRYFFKAFQQDPKISYYTAQKWVSKGIEDSLESISDYVVQMDVVEIFPPYLRVM